LLLLILTGCHSYTPKLNPNSIPNRLQNPSTLRRLACSAAHYIAFYDLRAVALAESLVSFLVDVLSAVPLAALLDSFIRRRLACRATHCIA
jgi:hypothetical protein